MEPVKTKEKQLLIMAILYLILQAASIVLYGIDGGLDLEWTIMSALCAVANFVMYASYKSHTKNIMKPMIGVAMTLLLVLYLSDASDYIQWWNDYLEWYVDLPAVIAGICMDIASCLVLLLMIIMHFVINGSHESNPKLVKFNRILFCIFSVLLLAYVILGFTAFDEAIAKAYFICGSLSDVFMLGMIVTIETSLDEFRIQREKK